MLDTILQLINGIPAELAVFILSMTPVLELRGALPVAILIFDMPIYQAFVLVIIGNMIPAFLIIYGWESFVNLICKKWPWLNKQLEKWYVKTQVQWDKKIEKYGPWALALFVAIPLPGSGVWSGSLAAWIFGVNKRKALISMFIGAILSGLLVSLLIYTGLQVI